MRTVTAVLLGGRPAGQRLGDLHRRPGEWLLAGLIRRSRVANGL